jgi:parvulin-like peptidyl-prolyl isomerase
MKTRSLFLCLLALTLGGATGCRGKVVARVNGQVITQQQLVDEMLRRREAEFVLGDVIRRMILEQEAKKRGVQVTEQDLDQLIKEQKALSDKASWDGMVKQNPNFEQTLRDNMRPQLLLCRLVVDEKKARKFFNDHPEIFDTPAKVSYRRIVVKSKQEAEEVRGLLVAGKAKFEDLVKERSVDTLTKSKGGVLEDQPAPKGAMIAGPYAEASKVLESQPLDEYSPPVAYPYPENAYQIIQVMKRTPAQKARYEDHRIRALLAAASTGLQASNTLQELLQKATVEVLDPKFATLTQYYRTLKERAPLATPVVPGRPKK